MKRIVLTFVAAFHLTLSMAGGVAAASHDHPGTPGERKCHGQTVAALNQLGHSVDVNGVGNIAKALGVSARDVQSAIEEACNS